MEPLTSSSITPRTKPALAQSAALQGLNMLVTFVAVRMAKRASTEALSYATLLGGILRPLETFQAYRHSLW